MDRADVEQWKPRDVARLLALVEHEVRHHQEVVASLPVGLLVVSGDLVVVSANRAFRKEFGLRSDAVLNHPLEEALPLEGVAAHVREVLESGRSRSNLFYEYASAAGRRLLRVSIAPLRSWYEDNGLEAVVAVEDVTEVPALTAPPAAPAEVEFPPALQGLGAAIWEASPDCARYRFLNRYLAQVLGYAPERWQETDFWPSVLYPEDRDWVLAFHRETASSSLPRSCDYRAVAQDGRLVWLRDTVRGVADAEGRVLKLAGVTCDITDARRLEEQILRERQAAAVGRLSARVGHEFNNLLMVIRGYSEEVLRGMRPADALRADVEHIAKTTERLAGMVNQLTAATRIETPEPELFDLPALLTRLQAKLLRVLPEGVTLEILPSAPIEARGDVRQIEQSILGLVAQSGQRLAPGGRIQVECSAVELTQRHAQPGAGLPPGRYAALTVRDNGTPLDQEALQALFEPHLTPEAAPAAGLVHIYEVARLNGGSLWIDSLPGGGNVFTLHLPRSESEAVPAPLSPEPVVRVAAAPPSPPPPPPPRAPEGPETILVVEDDPGIRALMCKILGRQGYNVLDASSGEEALRISQTHQGQVNLLITDLMMPHMSGREIAERLRASRPKLRVLYVSGYTDDAEIQAGKFPPGTTYLQKPFTLGSLLEKVRECLAPESNLQAAG